jgi:60 kDa SS-A/Ro ribonucleoprotein
MVSALRKSRAPVPQSEPLTPEQVKNSAGGYVYQIDKWAQLRRFLILGSEGGSYYASETKLTKDNITVLDACIQEDALRAVELIVEISHGGKAAKNDYAIYALAALVSSKASDAHARQAGYHALPLVCRTGTHIFMFCEFVDSMRGWGRGLRRAVATWYLSKTPDALAYQVVKYQQRGGWSHADLLRLSHPKTSDEMLNRLFKYIVDGWESPQRELPHVIYGAEAIKTVKDAKAAAVAIRENRLPREAVPTEFLKAPEVWEALLEIDMPITAMLRNLGNMTASGLLKPLSDLSWKVATTLQDRDVIRKGRVHPMTILTALRTYQQGHGFRGSNTWTPVSQIVDALDEAFYLAFDNVEPVNKPMLLALDVSGSMGSMMSGSSVLTCREATAALALITARTEPRYDIFGFSTTFMPLDITKRDRLGDALKKVSGLPFRGTDCAVPMLHALEQKIETDLFAIYTDNETWAGSVHPKAALDLYRQRMDRQARCAVVGMTSTGFSIADPNDPGMLDVTGMSTDTPVIINMFGRGEI